MTILCVSAPQHTRTHTTQYQMACIKTQNATISNTLFARNIVCDNLHTYIGPVTQVTTGDYPVAAHRFVDQIVDGLNTYAVEAKATPVFRCFGVSLAAAAAAGALVPITVMGVVDVEVHPESPDLLPGSPVYTADGGYATATETAGQAARGYVIGQGVAAGAGGLISARVIF